MQLQINDIVKAGIGEDRDTGRVDAIAGNQVTVAWDSGVRTTQSVESLVDDGELEIVGHRD